MKLKKHFGIHAGTAVRTVMLIVAVIVAISGALQMYKGVKAMRGASRGELSRLLTESDQALGEGQRLAKEATPAFQQLLSSVDSLGLEAFRAQQKETATKTNAVLGSAVEQFRLAHSKIEEARKVNKLPKLTRFLELKSQSYDLIAQGLAINQDMIAMVLDESVSALDVLLPKLKEAASRRDALEQHAQTVSNEATALGKELEANK